MSDSTVVNRTNAYDNAARGAVTTNYICTYHKPSGSTGWSIGAKLPTKGWSTNLKSREKQPDIKLETVIPEDRGMTIGSEGLSLEKDQSSSEERGPVDSGEGSTVRRGQPKCSGVYVKGYVNHVPVWMTVDTRASKTILSSRVFWKIRGSKNLKYSKGNVYHWNRLMVTH